MPFEFTVAEDRQSCALWAQQDQQTCQPRTCIYAALQIAAGARTAVFGSRARAQRCALVEHEPDDARRGPDGLGAGAVVGAERVARRRRAADGSDKSDMRGEDLMVWEPEQSWVLNGLLDADG